MLKIILLSAACIALLPTSEARAVTLPSEWTVTGNAGAGLPNGDMTAPPVLGPGYYYVSSNGGVGGGGALPGVGGSGSPTIGSNVITQVFSALAGDVLEFYFNYMTSDGSGYADYGWARLLDAAEEQVSLLFTARTTPEGSSVPGFDMPDPEATLEPANVSIMPNLTVWDALGDSSGTCWSLGCGTTGWVKSTYTILNAGDYKLQFGVTDWGDTAFSSAMAFAGAKIGDVIITPPPDVAPIPLPASSLLLLGGLGGIGIMKRRRKA